MRFVQCPKIGQLVLAGSPGYGAAEAVQSAADSPAASRIHLTGYLTEEKLRDWYARAAIFAFPSLDEGFGMPALEAMAAGIPVIAGNRSALPEVCGSAAELIDPSSEEEISAALVRLAQDQCRREELVALGIERAKQLSLEGRGGEHSLRIPRVNVISSSSGAFVFDCDAKCLKKPLILGCKPDLARRRDLLLLIARVVVRRVGGVCVALVEPDRGFENQEDVITGTLYLADRFRNSLGVGERLVDRVSQVLHEAFEPFFHVLPLSLPNQPKLPCYY